MTQEEFKKLRLGDIIEFNMGEPRWHFKGIVKKINSQRNGFWINMTWGDWGGMGKKWVDENIITNIEFVKIIEKHKIEIPKSESFTAKSGDVVSSEIRHAQI